MPSTVIVNGLGLTYKGTIGISTATIPDVCKTPSPGGPVPIPYPNIATQSSLSGGTTTVKAHGQMIAVKGSQYASSNGDEAGTAGGVKSSVNMKATDWITYSFDVKMDGKNACRHTDKKFHNNQNTVDLQGNSDPMMTPGTVDNRVCCAIKKCDRKHYDLSDVDQMSRCSALGTKKHTCVEKELANEPDLNCEMSFDMMTRLPTPILNNGHIVAARAAKKVLRYLWGMSPGASLPAGAVRRPDVCTGTGPTCDVYDAKFPCPKSVKSGTKSSGRMDSDLSRDGASMMSEEQKQDYQRIAGKKGKVKAKSPADCKEAPC